MSDIGGACLVVVLERKAKASASADCEHLSLVPRFLGSVF